MANKMARPQFSIKTMLWLMAVVAAFLGGAEWARRGWEQEKAGLLTELRLAADRAEADHRNFLECDAERFHLEQQIKQLKEQKSSAPR
jgi:hypothetical protein